MKYYQKTIDTEINYLLNQINQEGWIAYEYNPFYNFRSSQNYIYPNYLEFRDRNEVKNKYIIDKSKLTEENKNQYLEPGILTDLVTNQFGFSLKNPVNILAQPSYDGSVNLILNDNLNKPKLINSRFTQLPANKYRIVDRAGNTDTNIYDYETFDTDTSLYKITNTIPKIVFQGLDTNGNLKVGNYVFYFKLTDADGNETNFIGESGIVTCYIGNINATHSIRGGIHDENSYKKVNFFLYNIDQAYDYLKVYYTRSTGTLEGSEVTTAHLIDKKFPVLNGQCNLQISGFEPTQDISIDDINIKYFLADKVQAQAIVQNRLFFGRIHKPSVDYENLKDLSLRIYPFYEERDIKSEIGEVNEQYFDSTGKYMYYNTNNIYYKLGYWNNEIYRLGIVYIMSNDELSPVFNIRGLNGIPNKSQIIQSFQDNDKSEFYQYFSVYIIDKYGTETNKRQYINIDTEYNIAGGEDKIENSKGVISINQNDGNKKLYSLGVYIDQDVLKELGTSIKGFFIVRQKRVPTVLCQALIGPYNQDSELPGFNINQKNYLESFESSNNILTNDFSDHKLFLDKDYNPYIAYCPEYELRQPYFNNLFTGTDFSIQKVATTTSSVYKNFTLQRGIHYETKDSNSSENNNSNNNSLYAIQAVPDNIPFIRINGVNYRARAGEAEEAFRFREYNNRKIRGSFGPYLGIPTYDGNVNDIINIYVPNYKQNDKIQYFKNVYDDDSAYYSISERIVSTEQFNELQNIKLLDNQGNQNNLTNKYVFPINDIYRGDCYICQFTHRYNRNFQDPEAPNNDEIVDANTFKDHYEKNNSEENALINRGDVNAVQLGVWLTFTVKSSINLSLRNYDDSYPTEFGLTGVNRSFYPLTEMSVSGNYKIPESFISNAGLSSTTSDQYHFQLPDVPYVKNEFSTRIAYSDFTVSDAFKNGLRVFQETHYKDYPMLYGGITSLMDFYGQLICVHEHGVSLLPINERAVAGSGSGGDVFINTSNVLPEAPMMLSDMYGSQWADSVCMTPYYIYGIDTVAKKIWRTNGKTLDIISDFYISKFLIENISLTEREMTPLIGVRNVKTHYNAFKGDVIFTFYDNLYGFEEKVWSICYNEMQQKWITMYSWVPSFSANIDNIMFTFDRNTSKAISKIAISNHSVPDAEGVTLLDTIISNKSWSTTLALKDRVVPESNKTNIYYFVDYSIEETILRLDKYFYLEKNQDYERAIEYWVSKNGNVISDENTPSYYTRYKEFIEANNIDFGDGLYTIHIKPDIPDKVWKSFSARKYLELSIKSTITCRDYSANQDLADYVQGWKDYQDRNLGFYQNNVGLVMKDVYDNNSNLDTVDENGNVTKTSLTTDFWKHGQAGLIDIQDEIRPCYWYGEQHPFEFQYVVNTAPGVQKIWNNMQIISNNVAPESIHYYISGDNYVFSEDLRNAYFRQEITKKQYQEFGSDILYNREVLTQKYANYFKKPHEDNPYKLISDPMVRNKISYIFPWFYERIDTYNDIYNKYQLFSKEGRDYQNLSGTEVVFNKKFKTFNIAVHQKMVDLQSKKFNNTIQYGPRIIRGNMQYQENKWLIQLPTIQYQMKNETDAEWMPNMYNPNGIPPMVLNNIPNDIKNTVVSVDDICYPYDENSILLSDRGWTNRQEARLRDKYLEVRVRYTGDKLVLIQAINTDNEISYA